MNMQKPEIIKVAPRVYRCTRCGHETVQTTNHRGATWSCGRFNTCTECPPFAKYPEFGGSTTWNYVRDLED